MRSETMIRRAIGVVVFLGAVGSASVAHAQIGVGTWERTDKGGNGMTMTVSACCNGGRRLVYHIPSMGGQPEGTMSVDSPFNGSDVPTLVGGKPSGQTMAITRVDDRHYTAVIKMNGQPFGTSTATMSADGKTLTVESAMSMGAGGAPGSKTTEVWVKK